MLAGGALLAGGATVGSATTNPSVVINVRVTVTDEALSLSRYSGRRGWGAIFTIVNRGKKPHRVTFGEYPTQVLPPGGRLRVNLFLEYRGPQPISVTLNRAGPKHSAVFRVT
jgi:hypothetical protein